jgi:excisionase family DNA binding protein
MAAANRRQPRVLPALPSRRSLVERVPLSELPSEAARHRSLLPLRRSDDLGIRPLLRRLSFPGLVGPVAVNDRLLTASELAERLSVPEGWVREQTRANAIPHLRLGRYRRYEWPAVATWLEGQRSGRWRKHRPSVPPRSVA